MDAHAKTIDRRSFLKVSSAFVAAPLAGLKFPSPASALAVVVPTFPATFEAVGRHVGPADAPAIRAATRIVLRDCLVALGETLNLTGKDFEITGNCFLESSVTVGCDAVLDGTGFRPIRPKT